MSFYQIGPDGIYVQPSDDNVWQSFELNKVKKFVRPSSWRFDGKDSLQAYEFFESDNESTPEPSKQFYEKLYQVLLKNRLQNTFGIFLLENYGNNGIGVESTDDERRANVVTFTDDLSPSNDKYRPATWHFAKENNGSKCCRTYSYCTWNEKLQKHTVIV